MAKFHAIGSRPRPQSQQAAISYTDLLWQALPPLAALPTDLSISLRLSTPTGSSWPRPMARPPPSRRAPGLRASPTALRPCRSANTPPGAYILAVIAYRQDDAAPLLVDANQEQAWPLGPVREIVPFP